MLRLFILSSGCFGPQMSREQLVGNSSSFVSSIFCCSSCVFCTKLLSPCQFFKKNRPWPPWQVCGELAWVLWGVTVVIKKSSGAKRAKRDAGYWSHTTTKVDDQLENMSSGDWYEESSPNLAATLDPNDPGDKINASDVDPDKPGVIFFKNCSLPTPFFR